jgi:competence protein ComEC
MVWIRALENESRSAQPGAARRASFAASNLEVRMFNVGEGEAILIVHPDKRTWLVDGGVTNSLGPNAQLAQLLQHYLERNGLTLEACVASHPHVDHAGALASLLTSGSPALAPVVSVYRADTAWTATSKWLSDFHKALAARGSAVKEVPLSNAHREISVATGVVAHLFAGSGAGPYTSLFLQLRYHSARLLFTGDSQCPYELKLLNAFGAADFRADMLKITHHGSSSGTAAPIVEVIKPAFAIASTAPDDGHRLELDTLDRILGPGNKRLVFETLVDGDIVVRTDGQPYNGGVLYQVEFDSPGEFAGTLNAQVIPANQIHRQLGHDPHCQ